MIKFIELFAGVGGFRHGLEACNIESAHIGKEPEQEECAQRGEWLTDEQGALLCSGNKPSLCSDDSKASGLETEQRTAERILRCGSDASEPAGRHRTFTCVYANEWDKYAASIYRRHYGTIDTRDITTVNVSEIPEHDLLTAGFPCQAFSVAGKRLGFQDTRGTLFFEIARILKSKRPGHILLENVKGLLSHEQGQTFNTILGVLSDLGYRVEWMVLNSKHFGVPQNRERVFIIGHLRGRCSGQVFPVRGENTGLDGQVVSTAVDGNYWKGIDNHAQRTMIIHNKYGGFDEDKPREFDISPTIRTPQGGGHLPDVLVDSRIRRLTPTECERLQGFPDGWTSEGLVDGEIVEISDTQRYKAMGNAVTTNVITAIGSKLLEHLENECE